jgi:hypothetical protein
MQKASKPWYKHVWILRLVYIALAILCYPAMFYAIQILSVVTGLTYWQEHFGSFIVFNDQTGPGIMADFVVMLFFIALSMVFIFKAFSATEELRID